MPLYEYRCPSPTCATTIQFRDAPDGPQKKLADARQLPCPDCATPVRRRFSWTSPPMLHEHYNHTTGSVVSGHRDFRNQLRRMSAEQEARTGIATNLQPVDHRDLVKQAMDTYGDAGLKEQHDAAVKRGEKEPTGKKVL